MTKRYRKPGANKPRASKSLNVMEELRIDFLSPVDRPAQEGAEALLLKRHDGQYDDSTNVIITKEAPGVMTTGTDGHTHIVWLHGRIGETTLQISPDAERMHDHPWVLNPDGTITIGENDGHTHAVAPDAVTAALIEMQKSDGAKPDHGQLTKEITMPEPKKTTKTVEDLESTVAELTERAELTSIVAGMTDAEKAHFSTLGETEKRSFVSKSTDERTEEIAEITKAAEDENPVVYTATDGTVIRKSDGSVVLALAKRADKSEKRAIAAEEVASTAGYSKRASVELSHLPGSVEERSAMLKAIDGIEDADQRKAALSALKAGNAALEKGFHTAGTSLPGDEDEGSPQGQLDTLVKRYVESHEGVTEAGAYSKVLETPEGKALYTEMDQQ